MCSRRSVSRRVNRDLSLEELEGRRWSVPAGGETRLMATVRELRRKPIGGLTVEDMRLLIRQDVGLAYLLPLAMEVLRVNPLAEGDMYEGDLLAAVPHHARGRSVPQISQRFAGPRDHSRRSVSRVTNSSASWDSASATRS
ncbi:contact-dependent growth inhibition system immunity protein [Streptomyces nigra]|uniref:contact-dependent growth inhibition system immunity protein n=1 Tax=Streptomyces nigra TaxID=1827580 RepID=UPI0038183895